jgi:hypothetical protein
VELTTRASWWRAAFGLVLLAGSAGPLCAQDAAGTRVDGFGVRYDAPAGWTLSGRDGRIQAWTDAAQRSALVFYAGHFAPLELALGDAQRVLGVPRDEDTQIITPLAPAQFGGRAGMAGSLRVTGERSVVAHVAVVQLDDSTALGAVAVLEGGASTASLDSAVARVATVLAGASAGASTPDAALHDRLAATWEVQTAYTSSPTGGGYTNEESWAFAADGTYAYRKRFSVSVPGANVTPEERDEAGRWYTVGNALVLISEEGRLTVDVQFDGALLVLDGTRFNRRTP